MPGSLVTLATFRDLPEALLAKGKLESAGIACFLADDNMVRTDWFWSNAIGGVKLKVEQEDVEAAMEVLSEEIPESLPAQEKVAFRQPKCPQCGSLDVRYDSPWHGLRLALLWFLPIPAPAGRKRWMCEACGAQWREESDPR